jgi:hypothetical protein
MARFIAVACALSLAACATPASKSEIENATSIMLACMQRTAPTLDDYTSEAITVAYAVIGSCNAEIVSVADLISKGSGLINRQYTRRRMNEVALKLATEVVLKGRKMLK